MHVENELVEFIPAREQEYEEVIEEYEEEVDHTGGSPIATN